MNVDELQSVQARERQSDSLQELRPSFYRDAAEFVAELREERAEVAADAEEPFEDPTVTQLTDDIRTAEQTVEAIYERRVGKVVKLASLAAANMPGDAAGLTTEEQELYEALSAAIEDHREGVLSTLSGDVTADAPPSPPHEKSTGEAGPSTAPEADVDAADLMDGGSDRRTPPPEAATEQPRDGRPENAVNADDDSRSSGGDSDTGEDDERRSPEPASDNPADNIDDERTTVRITQDVGAILGVDEREYDLATDDVVTLPAANAEPLIERDAAERLE